MDDSKQLLDIRNLEVCFNSKRGLVRAVNGVNLSIEQSKILGLVGESGSGKSVTAMAIMGLIKPPGKILNGEIIFNGENLLKKSKDQMRRIRGDRIGMIFQSPSTSLNPVLRIGEQVAESLVYHRGLDRKTALDKSVELLEKVHIPNPRQRINEYPHQLSGGMKQRVMIAIALACQPALLIADEPTTALDVTIQSQIMDLINDLRNEFNTTILLITHDIGIVAEVADQVIVMYCGKICCFGDVQSILIDPPHPYLEALLKATPSIDEDREFLDAIPGTIPHLESVPKGCVFSPRCKLAIDKCFMQEPALSKYKNSTTACWLRYS
jgi:peptide/nickel transport system ATP-binding protein